MIKIFIHTYKLIWSPNPQVNNQPHLLWISSSRTFSLLFFLLSFFPFLLFLSFLLNWMFLLKIGKPRRIHLILAHSTPIRELNLDSSDIQMSFSCWQLLSSKRHEPYAGDFVPHFRGHLFAVVYICKWLPCITVIYASSLLSRKKKVMHHHICVHSFTHHVHKWGQV